MDDWFDEFLLSLQPDDVEFRGYEFTRQTRAEARQREELARNIKKEPDDEGRVRAAAGVPKKVVNPAPQPPGAGEQGEANAIQEGGGAANAGEEHMEEDAPEVIILDSDDDESFDEAGFRSLNLTLPGVSHDDDTDSVREKGTRQPVTSDLPCDRHGVKLEPNKLIPKIPGYLCTRTVGRVYAPTGYLTGGISQKALRAPFIKAFRDGRYWGWSGRLKFASYPAADFKSCSTQETREHLHHLYQVGHFMGQVADEPGQDAWDLSIHQEIAQVRRGLFTWCIRGSMKSFGTAESSQQSSQHVRSRVLGSRGPSYNMGRKSTTPEVVSSGFYEGFGRVIQCMSKSLHLLVLDFKHSFHYGHSILQPFSSGFSLQFQVFGQ